MPDELKAIKNLLVQSVQDACNEAFDNLLDEEVNSAMDGCLNGLIDRRIKEEFNLEVWVQHKKGNPISLNIDGSWLGCDSLITAPLKKILARYIGLQLGWVKDEEARSPQRNCLEAIDCVLADFSHINKELKYLLELIIKNCRQLEEKKKRLDKGGVS